MAKKTEFKKYVQQLTKEELVKELEKLYTKLKPVQEFYQLDLGTDSTQLLNDYKRKLFKIFNPRGRFINPSMSEANKIIKDFSKISVHAVDTIDLMLYKAELSVELFETWGHEFPSVVNSFTTGYDKVVRLIQENNIENHFKERCINIQAYGLNYGLINETI